MIADGTLAAGPAIVLDTRLTVAQMSAELLRELGVLLVAFGPLDYLFSEGASLTTGAIGAIVALGLVFTIAGVVIERSRPV